MTSDTFKIFDREILVTKKPFNFYLTGFLLTTLLLSFFIIIEIRQLDFEGSISLFFVYLFISVGVYANFGQYLATITLYGHRIEVKYIFSWNKNVVFEFDKLTELNFKKIPFYSGRDRWYIGANWLYLKNEKGQVCQFKYNINNSDNKKLLDELSKTRV